jgi:hypothetical protein
VLRLRHHFEPQGGTVRVVCGELEFVHVRVRRHMHVKALETA